MGNVERRGIAAAPAKSWQFGTLRHQNSHKKNPCLANRGWAINYFGCTRKTADYTATGNLMRKVLDFIQFGGPDYTSVWLFTKNLVVEIRNPLNEGRIQYEIAPFRQAVDWIRLNARRYEFEEPTETSQLDLEFTTMDGLSAGLSATGQGCRHLMTIYRDRFLANFTGTRGVT